MSLRTDCPLLVAPATLLLSPCSVWLWMGGYNCAFYCHRSCRNLKASPACTPRGLNCFSQKYSHAVDPHPYWSTHAQTLKTNRQTPPKRPHSVVISEEWSACGEVLVQNLLPSNISLLQLASTHAAPYRLDMRGLANLSSGWGRSTIKLCIVLSWISTDYVPNFP